MPRSSKQALRLFCTCAMLAGFAAACDKSSKHAEPVKSVDSAPRSGKAEPPGDRASGKTAASATKSWLALHENWQAIQAMLAKKPVATCTKSSPPSNAVGFSIGSSQVAELARDGAPHNHLMSGGGTTSEALTKALTVPFLERERRVRDWDPEKAAKALTELQSKFFPMTVLRIDRFTAPQVSGERRFRPGQASTTVFFFENTTKACAFKLVTKSEKTVSALTLGGSTGGPEAVNARLANDLEQSVQREAGLKLVALGKLGSLAPVVPSR